MKISIADILRVSRANNIGTYIGCRNIDWKQTRKDFVDIKDRISSKLAGQKARCLSSRQSYSCQVELTGIPLFTMQGIKIPNCIAREVDNTNIDFFWTRIWNLIVAMAPAL